MSRAYKLLTATEWASAQTRGCFEGSALDLADGYIHLSAGPQVAETARRHFSGQSDLVLLVVDLARVEAEVRWEPSRGGELFPHVYGVLPVAAVDEARPLALDAEGAPVTGDTP